MWSSVSTAAVGALDAVDAQLRPAAPPAMPKAPAWRPLDRIDAVIGSRKRTRRTPPSPPRQRPGAARAGADRVALQPHREAELEHLGVGQARVGHVGLHDAVPSKPPTRPSASNAAGARAAGDRLVVLVARVAEGEVVHRALAGRHHAERAVERVGDAGRGLDVAGDHRRRRPRVEHRALGDDHLQRLQAAGVERDVVVDQGAEHVEHRGHAAPRSAR